MQITLTGIQVFGFNIGWYAIIIVGGAWFGTVVAAWAARHEKEDGEHVWRALPAIVLCSLGGARLWFIFFPPASIVDNGRTAGWFLSHFFDLNQGAVALWTGGLGLIGGIAGGIFALWRYTRDHKLPFLPWLDIGALGLCAGQIIARWGNAANQDLYGPPTGLPWGVLVNNETQRVGIYTDLAQFPLATTRFHPVYLYESLWTVLVLAVLLWLFLRHRDRLRAGDLTLVYVILYGVGRFLLEFLRVNVSHVGGINISQAVVGIAVVAAFLLLAQRTTRTSNPRHRQPDSS